MKKLVVIGRGTGGAITAACFDNLLSDDWIIEWHYDSSIQTQAVGEGLNILPCVSLNQTVKIEHHDLIKIDGTFKSGIFKKNWGSNSKGFFHTFMAPAIAWHINAVKLQNYIFEYLKSSKRIKYFDCNSKIEEIDADYVIDCSGRPTQEQLDKDFVIADYIPVNAVHVTQCFWDVPKFQYSLTSAHKGGWYFGIPLQNRCAIGMMYNKNFNTLDEIKEEANLIIEENGLTSSNTTNSFQFTNYYKKINFFEKHAYNGNASFFLEPLEATTIGQIVANNILISRFLNKEIDLDTANFLYNRDLEETSAMILLHYYAGSVFNNKFWDYAQETAKTKLFDLVSKSDRLQRILKETYAEFNGEHPRFDPEFECGTWPRRSYGINIKGLGILEKLKHDFNL